LVNQHMKSPEVPKHRKSKATKRRTVVMSCRVSRRFAELIKRFCQLDGHINPADLLRDSVREKIQREAPELYRQLFQEAQE